MLNDEEKRELVEAPGITIDGHPARVMGARMRFATVVCLLSNEPDHCAEFAWETVDRIVHQKNGRFTSRGVADLHLTPEEAVEVRRALTAALAKVGKGSPRYPVISSAAAKVSNLDGVNEPRRMR